MFLNTKIAQNLSGSLIRPTLQSEKKIFKGQKTSGIPYFQLSEEKILPLTWENNVCYFENYYLVIEKVSEICY